MDEIEYSLRGFYRPSFFSLYIDGEFRENLSDMTEVDLGTFVHEYIHYLQNITTIFGLQNSSFYFNFLYDLKKHIVENESITVPLTQLKHSEKILRSKIRFKMCNGSNEISNITYDEVRVSVENIIEQNITVESVIMHFFLKGKEIHSIIFGNNCVKESMAHLYQQIFDSEVKHVTIPYKTAEILCSLINPEILSDKRKLIALCLISLNSQNSGLTFFELLNSTQTETTLSGIELYKKYLTQLKVRVGDKELNIKDYLLFSLNRFKEELSASLFTELKHFKLLIDNIILSAEQDFLPLIEILYENDIDNITKLMWIKEFYGIPHIRTISENNYFPKDIETGTYSLEFIELIGQRIVLDRLLGTNRDILGDSCSLIPQCQLSDEELMEENCYHKQWEKTINCPFKIVSDNWQLNKKIQNNK